MDFVIDGDVRLVLSVMQRRIPASRLVGVAQAVAQLAPIAWGHFRAEAVRGVDCRSVSLGATQSSASECPLGQQCVDDDSEKEAPPRKCA
jgi:hypothetical protein